MPLGEFTAVHRLGSSNFFGKRLVRDQTGWLRGAKAINLLICKQEEKYHEDKFFTP